MLSKTKVTFLKVFSTKLLNLRRFTTQDQKIIQKFQKQSDYEKVNVILLDTKYSLSRFNKYHAKDHIDQFKSTIHSI